DHGVVGANRIPRDDVDVGERQRLGDGLAPRDEELFVFADGGSRLCRGRCHVSVASPASDGLVFGVLARDTRGDLDAADVEVSLQLLLVLPAETEAVRADRRLLVPNLGAEPRRVRALVLPSHAPIARLGTR